jgi:hypothetical protein
MPRYSFTLAAINESLVQYVLKEMLKYKPSLQKVLSTGGEEEFSDPRYVGQLVIRNFPSPIGVELRRLFSISLRQPDNLRLEQIYFSIERCLQFISFIMISQLWNEERQYRLIIPENFGREFAKRIVTLNIDNYIWFIRSIRILFEDNSVSWFMPEIKDNLDNSFFKNIDFQSPVVSESGRYQFDLSLQEMENYCKESEEKLLSLLQQISFLCNYRLASIKEIKVIKAKYRSPQYLHALNILGGDNTGPRSMEIVRDNCAESHSVLLFKSQITLDEYLNLTPLIIDTGTFLAEDKENFDVKNDIMLYHKAEGNNLLYNGSEVTEKSDLRIMKNYPLILSQFRDMVETISGTGSSK